MIPISDCRSPRPRRRGERDVKRVSRSDLPSAKTENYSEAPKRLNRDCYMLELRQASPGTAIHSQDNADISGFIISDMQGLNRETAIFA